MEFPDHVDRQRPPSIQHFRDTRSTPEVRLEISSDQTPAFHVIEECVDRIGWLDRLVLFFVALDQRGQDVEPVAGRGPRPGFQEAFDLFQSRSVIGFRLDWTNVHGDLTRS